MCYFLPLIPSYLNSIMFYAFTEQHREREEKKTPKNKLYTSNMIKKIQFYAWEHS